MRDVYEVLREKQAAVERLHREVVTLRLVAPLLADDADVGPALRVEPSVRTVAGARRVRSQEPLRTAETPVANESDRRASDVRLGAAKRISNRLKRLATPLLSAVISLADSSSS